MKAVPVQCKKFESTEMYKGENKNYLLSHNVLHILMGLCKE